MWFIDTSTFQLREFAKSFPPFATFSYVTDGNEASFIDFAWTKRDHRKESVRVIERACVQARTAGFDWLWNHAACVDKRSCAAQSETINSLAQIYRDCGYSIIYLGDLDDEPVGDEMIGERLAECRWIKNIWAIPQIIFAREIHFFSSGWAQIGTKGSLLRNLSSITGIDEPVLEDSACLEDYSVARRMSWASEMTASRAEDFGYALLGLFNVSMLVIYGEQRKSFLRLQEEIIRDTDDFSFLAWDSPDVQEFNGLFADSPACFRGFRNGPVTPLRINGEAQVHCTGITIQTSFLKTEIGLFLPLRGQNSTICCIPLSRWNGCFVRRGSKVKWNPSGQISLESMRICVKRDLSAYLSRKISADGGCDGGFVQDRSFGPLDMRGTARASICSVMDYNSNGGTGSVAPSLDNCGMTSENTPSESLSEVTSQDDPIAWSAHDIGSVEGTVRAFDGDVRPSWGHETTPEAHCGPGDCPVGDAVRGGFDSPCSDCTGKQVNDRPESSARSNESPPSEAQVLDVAEVTNSLADITVKQFFSGAQRQSNKRCFIPWPDQNRKRPKLMQSSDQLEVVHTSDFEDGETVLVNKASFFACPFYIRNDKHTKCVTRNHLHSIEEVKEHVCWEHRRPMFCPVCKEEFPSGRDRDAHIRLRICQSNDTDTPEGVTDDQEEQLTKEGELLMSEDLRWFQIWDIIFPHIERPSSTFYTGEREMNVSAFRRFWMQSGEEIVAAFLEKKECQSYSIRNEERKLRAIYDLVVEQVVDRIFASDVGDH